MRFVVAVAVLSGCIRPTLEDCADGRSCSAFQACDVVHHLCVDPDQPVACTGMPDGTHCAAADMTIVGTCDAGVCLPTTCGDGVVEPGEACDDGNRLAGDGCNETCTSTETCGNGVVDANEACDDGNLRSHDGCDSRCNTELERWSVEGIAPLEIGEGHALYNPDHRTIQTLDLPVVWSWDGVTWRVDDYAGPPIAFYAAVYDEARRSVIVIGSSSDETVRFDVVWEFAGGAWTQHAITGQTPPLFDGKAAYDRATGQIVLGGTGPTGTFGVWALAGTLDAWTDLAAPSPPHVSHYTYHLTYDDARTSIVVVLPAVPSLQPTPFTLEWDGAAWASTASGPPTTNSVLAFDPASNALVSIGGSDPSGGNPSNQVVAWTGAGWGAVVDEALPATILGAYAVFDDAHDQLVVFRDPQSTAALNRSTKTWSDTALDLPMIEQFPDSRTATFDPHARMFVTVNAGVTWLYDGAWHHGPNAPVTTIVFDPVEAAIVGVDASGGLWRLGGGVWTRLATPAPPSASNPVLAVDAARGRLALASDGACFELDPALGWVAGSTTPPNGIMSLAFDARNGELVGAGDGVSVLSNGTWISTLSPGEAYQVVADTRRGTVVFVGAGKSLWERSSSVWLEHPAPPLDVDGVAGYGDGDGTLYVVGAEHSSGLLLRRTWSAAGDPDETCVAGDDADGDGAHDCADPDCWWSCPALAACPPYATCSQ